MLDNSQKQRILVTGATGFIGRRLIDALRQRSGATILVVTRDVARIASIWPNGSVTGRIGDLARAESLNDVIGNGVETVFHLAGYTHAIDISPDEEERMHHRITVAGTEALLAAASRAGVRRFVFVSSVKAIGEGGDSLIDEGQAPAPTTSYGRAKRAAEELVLAAGQRTGMHVAILRLPLVYGTGNKGNIPRMIVAIDRGRFPPLPEVGNKRSMVHADDVVQALLLAADKSEANGQIYLVTDGKAYSSRGIYLAICRALGKAPWRWAVPAVVLRAAAHAGDLFKRLFGCRLPFNSEVLNKLLGSAWYSDAKIRRELGYNPRHTLESALPEMVAQYRGARQGV